MPELDLKEVLTRESAEYRLLLAKHRDFENRLSELQRKRFLTSEEEIERTNIKKHKLRIKDRMEALARQARNGS